MSELINFKDFEKVDVRVGVIIEVEDFSRALKPAYKLTIDLGTTLGIKRSSAQYTNYSKEELLGKQVIVVINLPEKDIAGFKSQCLVLGVPMDDGKVSLLSPTKPAALGGKMF